MRRRLLLTGTAAVLVGLSLRSNPAQSGPGASDILSVSGVSQDAAQPTLRPEHGHIARSRVDPTRAVKNAHEWASLRFG